MIGMPSWHNHLQRPQLLELVRLAGAPLGLRLHLHRLVLARPKLRLEARELGLTRRDLVVLLLHPEPHLSELEPQRALGDDGLGDRLLLQQQLRLRRLLRPAQRRELAARCLELLLHRHRRRLRREAPTEPSLRARGLVRRRAVVRPRQR